MKSLLKLEEIAIFLFCIFLFSRLNLVWWWFPAFLLLPDVGMIGYVINDKVGAFTYNLTHHRLTAIIISFYSVTYGDDYWKFIAIILIAHISFDRALGYGLKYTNSFQNTHLGIIGGKKKV